MLKKGSEDDEQRKVIDWAVWHRSIYPELKWLYHCPNGGSRNAIEAAKFKRLGVKPGIADLHLPYPRGIYTGLFIEMKYGHNRLQDTQKEFLRDMKCAGHFVCTCYGCDSAIEVLKEYLELSYDSKMSIANNTVLK